MVKLLKDLPIGTKVSLGARYYGEDIIFLLADKKKDNVLISEKVLTYKAFDAEEPTNPSRERTDYGNNRYRFSNILQWLNKSGSNWYSNMHRYDNPPTSNYVYGNPYKDEDGFLTGFSSDVLGTILNTEHLVNKPSYDGGGSEVVTTKIYLPSKSELGLPLGNGDSPDGEKWDLFSDDKSRIAYPTKQAVVNADNSNVSENKPTEYALRSVALYWKEKVVSVSDTGGYRSLYNCRDGFSGVRPALNLPKDVLVSGDDVDGVYKVIINTPPTITLDVQQNQVYYEGSTLNVAGKAKDTDVNDAVIVKYKIGSANERILTTQASQGKEFDYGKVLTFTKSRFYDGETPVSDVLLAGNTYQLQVWAQDDKGAKSTVETRNFTVVPNRKPLISVTDLPTLEGGTGITELSIKGTVNDPDGDDVTLTYKLNDGKETPLVVVEEAFEIDFTVEQLRVGVNNFTIIARDEYEALTTTTVQVNVNKVSGGTEHIKKVAVFDLDMQGKETDGAVLWVRRPFTDDTDYTASISTVEPDAVESYNKMEKTTQIVQGNNRDQFTGKNEAKGSKVSIKLDIEGEGNISMIQGVIK